MKNMIKAVTATLLLVLSTFSWAAGFDGKSNLLCTATEVYECDAASACRVLEAEDSHAVRHLDVDFREKAISLHHLELDFSSSIERSETVDNKLVLQGIEAGSAENEDGGGWTITIDNQYGTMVFTMAGQGYAFVGLGGCVVAR